MRWRTQRQGRNRHIYVTSSDLSYTACLKTTTTTKNTKQVCVWSIFRTLWLSFIQTITDWVFPGMPLTKFSHPVQQQVSWKSMYAPWSYFTLSHCNHINNFSTCNGTDLVGRWFQFANLPFRWPLKAIGCTWSYFGILVLKEVRTPCRTFQMHICIKFVGHMAFIFSSPTMRFF